MYKVYLAVGNEGVEKYIKSQKPLLEKMLNDTVNFVGVTVYKEGALQGIKDYHPDVVVLREGLQGNMDILDLIYKSDWNPLIQELFLSQKQEKSAMHFWQQLSRWVFMI